MGRRLGPAMVVAATLLTCLPAVSAAAAPVAMVADVTADDVFYPEGEEPSDDASADDATNDAPASSRDDREAALMRGSREAADLMGYLPSLYEGKWFMPEVEGVRRCIMDRESNFNYRATSGTYHGAYQMSAALARGATWMMQKEVRKELGAEGVEILRALRELTPNRWNRYWQDRAFWTIWRKGAGASHWRGGAYAC